MKRNIIKAISLILCSVLFLSCFGCSSGKSGLQSIGVEDEPVYPLNTDMLSHYCALTNLKEIDTSGLITLLYDERSSSVAVRITNSADSKLWSALPQYSDDESLSDEASVLSLEVIHDGKKYLLNSQDNSVALGGVYYDETSEGFQVTYLITDNGEWLKNIDLGATDEAYKSAAKGNILYKAVVTYSLKDGCFYSSLDWVNLGDEKDILVKIGFLEYFGAQSAAQQGDYIFVPDGSGAVIDIASTKELAPVDIAVYGNDISGENLLTSVVAAYGMKCGNDAYAAVIEGGDAVARITAKKAMNESNYNRVGPVFTVTATETDNDKVYYSDYSYNDSVSICFRFLSGANSTYAGMAAACREQLVRNYTLSTRSVEASEYMPVMVNVIGSAAPDGLVAFKKKLTTFSEAVDILSRIKSKGINNVYLRYSGALTGGTDERIASQSEPLNSLGGMSELNELNDYASGLNFKVFMDVALISDTKKPDKSVDCVCGDEFTVNRADVLTNSGFPTENNKRYITCVSSLEKTVLSVLDNFDAMDATGYCITDAGSCLYTDVKHEYSRVNVASEISAKIAPLSTSSPVMIGNGNFYALKNADVVSGLPMNSGRTAAENYTQVPFVQLILHGIIEYTYDGINTLSDSKTALLKCVEYGAVPGFVLTNNQFDEDEKYSKMFAVDNWLNNVYDAYSASGEVLNDLRSSRITNHYLVSPGVYCTEYESTTRIYVNYTNEPVTVSGITVAPMSFFRVN